MELHHSITEIKITCDPTSAVKIQVNVCAILGYALATHDGETKLKQFRSTDEVRKKDFKKEAKTLLVAISELLHSLLTIYSWGRGAIA